MSDMQMIPDAAYKEIETELASRGIDTMLPAGVSRERFVAAAVMALMRTPDLNIADRGSFVQALLRAAQDGLIPDGREAAITTFFESRTGKTLAQYIPMIEGVIKRAYQGGSIISVTARVVREQDEFDFFVDEDGEHILHRPAFGDAGGIRLVYALAKLTTGGVAVEVMTKTEVDAIKPAAATRASSPWVKHYDRMATKTALHRLLRRLPGSGSVPEDQVFEVQTQAEPQGNSVVVSLARRSPRLSDVMGGMQKLPAPASSDPVAPQVIPQSWHAGKSRVRLRI